MYPRTQLGRAGMALVACSSLLRAIVEEAEDQGRLNMSVVLHVESTIDEVIRDLKLDIYVGDWQASQDRAD